MTGTTNDITDAIKKLHSLSLNPLIDGINSNEYLSLKILISLHDKSADHTVHVSDITKELRISAPSVTKILNGLELKGLITRETDKTNRRNTIVFVTEKGVFVKKQNDLVISEFIADVYSKVGRENIIQFLHLSEIIRNAIDEEIEIYKNKKPELSKEATKWKEIIL